MRRDRDILKLVREHEALAERAARRAVIIQPGGLGDCILTLPLAQFMKTALRLGRVDFIGHIEYLEFLPGRSCVDCVRSMELIDFHRLFVEADRFNLEEEDPLGGVFSPYSWIVTFLGEPGSSFEQNLIFTAHCSRATEVTTLSLKPSSDFAGHVSSCYIQQFIEQNILQLSQLSVSLDDILIRASEMDIRCGVELLEQFGLNKSGKLVVIHPGSGGWHKCWHLDNFCSIAELLISNGYEVVFLLGPGELEKFDDAKIKQMANIGKCVSDLTLSQVLQLLSCADCFLGNDSGITHLCGALGVRTLAVFGPSSAVLYRPIGPSVEVFEIGAGDFSVVNVDLQQQLCRAIVQVDVM